MGIEIRPSGQAAGARVTGVDLTGPLEVGTVAAIRAAWLEHHVLAFPEQSISDDDLERFALAFGPFGDDPFVEPITGREHVIAVRHDAGETWPPFGSSWHTDLSFQARPPDGTCLYGITIPLRGGDTLYANQHAALDAMPAGLRDRLDGKIAIHSARAGYAPSKYGEADRRPPATMAYRQSEGSMATQLHPIIRFHPETGRPGLFGCLGYIIGLVGVDGRPVDGAGDLLVELYNWQTREEFWYRHEWELNMLVMWDNRSVLHQATGGHEGFDRLLHRTTIGATH